MSWFSKVKINKDSEIFLSEFPAWVAIHSAKLVDGLELDKTSSWAKILENKVAKERLVNCFIGAHVFYLQFSPEGELIASLFGEDALGKALFALPNKAKIFFTLAYELYEKNSKNGKDSLTSSLEDWYKIKIDPLDAHVAFIAHWEVSNNKEFSVLPGELLSTLNLLQVQQLGWLKGIVDKWSKVK